MTARSILILAIISFTLAMILGAFEAAERRGFNKASAIYDARLAAMAEANRDAVEKAHREMQDRTATLITQLADTEARLQEILNDDGQDYDGVCGAPVRALRLLDQIR